MVRTTLVLRFDVLSICRSVNPFLMPRAVARRNFGCAAGLPRYYLRTACGLDLQIDEDANDDRVAMFWGCGWRNEGLSTSKGPRCMKS